MAQKTESKKNSKEGKPSGILGGIPLGSALDVVDSVGGVLFKLFLRRYQVEEKIEQAQEDARQKAQEIKAEAIKTGYAVKKAFFRAIVEAIFLTTGLLALIIGVMMVLSDVVPLKFILVGYGIIVTAAIIFILKTQK